VTQDGKSNAHFPCPGRRHHKLTTSARLLADFARRLDPEKIPIAVRDNVALRLLDTLGCALTAVPMSWAAGLLEPAREWGGLGASSVVGSSLRIAAPMAALANGALAHGLDFDDTHTPSITHASAVVLPAALALGEARRLSGAETLAAAVAGYETITRLGMAAPGAFHARGWHATPVCGAFAAAVTAGRCLGLAADRLASAVGIAASCASGLLEFLEDGSSVKRLHPGWAAHSGVLAAGLAGAGMTGPATGLEGRFGFYRAALGEAPDLGPWLATLGTRWETLAIAFKPYPCCHYNHAHVDAARHLRETHAIAPDAIREVECVVPAGEVAVVCEPADAKRAPRSEYDAKFSLPFAVAAALLDGHVGVGTFTEARLGDPALLALAARVRYTVDPDSPFPRTFPGHVRIHLTDGRSLEARVAANRGGPESPLPTGEIVDKFRDNAARALPESRARELEKAALGLEGLDDVGSVLSLARRDG
jgi:2-methylcitrate dehydratase PrpD